MNMSNSTLLSDYVQSTKQSKPISTFAPQKWWDSVNLQSFKNSLSQGLPGWSGSENASTQDVETTVSGSSISAKGKAWFSNESAPYGLSRTQRIIGFACCLFAGMFCFGLASVYIPVLIFKARKFVALYSLGSCFFIFSFSLLWGPMNYIKHLFSQARLPVTCSYFVSLIATLYSALWIQSTILTTVCAITQIITLVWFVLSYVPGGETSLKFIIGAFRRLICGRVKAEILPV